MAHGEKSVIIATGLAMFSMFFGAGNVVFPLALGQIAQDQNFYAILGMLITAVGVPFVGLMAMMLFDGDYDAFFARIGKLPGFLVVLFIMGLIGPFGAIPRCIALSYSTAKIFLPDVFSLPVFSIISCMVIWLFTIKRNSIIDTLGYVLTPLLIGSLAIIIVKGVFTAPSAPETDHGVLMIFLKGLRDGYQTMDLLGAFFFSSVIIECLRDGMDYKNVSHHRLMKTIFKSVMIGAFLLSITYIGFSYVAAFHSETLEGIPSDELISLVAIHILGPNAAIVACLAVVLACLTTAIALTAVFAEFIHKDIAFDKINYNSSLILTLIAAFLVSTLDFKGIVGLLAPILQICYPALLVLSLLNIFYKLYDFKPVKAPVLITLILSIGAYFI